MDNFIEYVEKVWKNFWFVTEMSELLIDIRYAKKQLHLTNISIEEYTILIKFLDNLYETAYKLREEKEHDLWIVEIYFTIIATAIYFYS